jgi:hypothetical protein
LGDDEAEALALPLAAAKPVCAPLPPLVVVPEAAEDEVVPPAVVFAGALVVLDSGCL